MDNRIKGVIVMQFVVTRPDCSPTYTEFEILIIGIASEEVDAIKKAITERLDAYKIEVTWHNTTGGGELSVIGFCFQEFDQQLFKKYCLEVLGHKIMLKTTIWGMAMA